MSWTSPTTRATGDLISASIWNTDIVNNLLSLGNIRTFTTNITSAGSGWQSLTANFGFTMATVRAVVVNCYAVTNGASLAAWSTGAFNTSTITIVIDETLGQTITVTGIVIGT